MGGSDRPQRPAGAEFEPLRPSDPKWRCRHGDLRSDFGPIFALVNVEYAEGQPAIQLQEDGSGFALYRSGRKAVCLNCHHRSRRVSAVAYADEEFWQKSAAYELTSPADRADSKSLASKAKRTKSRTLGAIDEWGIGVLETIPEGTTGVRGRYEVSATHVQVQTVDGRVTKVSRAALAGGVTGEGGTLQILQLRLSPELVVSYDNTRGTTSLEFSCDGVHKVFQIGEVWRPTGTASFGGTQKSSLAPITTPMGVLDAITLRSQASLDASNLGLTETSVMLDTTLKIAPGHRLPSTQTLTSSLSAPTLRVSLDAARSLCDGRIDFTTDIGLKKKLSTEVHPTLQRTQIGKPLREGYTFPERHPGKPPWPQVVRNPPLTLEALPAYKILELVTELEHQSVLLVVLLVASWAMGSNYSSSNHARGVCEAALGDLRARGIGDKLRFCETELSEAGAIFSETRWVNPVVKQCKVKEAPWMVMFHAGQMVFSGNPQGLSERGGLGFASRIRMATFGKPRVLILEPPPSLTRSSSTGNIENGEIKVNNNYRLQLETQEVVRRMGFEFDLALSISDAVRMIGAVNPVYGILLASSEIGASNFGDLSSRMRNRNPKAASFICHSTKMNGILDESLFALVGGSLAAGVLERPLTKSSFERAIEGREVAKTAYPVCGMVKGALVDFVAGKLAALSL